MTRPALFIDDGGVMNENVRRGRQWEALPQVEFQGGRRLSPVFAERFVPRQGELQLDIDSGARVRGSSFDVRQEVHI